MGRFTAKLLAFIGLQMLLATAGVMAYRIKLRLLPLEPGLETVVCGDSHVRTAMDSKLMTSAVNTSHTSEHYLYTYQKLKLVLSRSNTIRHVIVGVSFHSFSAFLDRYVEYNENILREANYDPAVWDMYPRYFLMMDGPGKWFVMRRNPVCLLRSFRRISHELSQVVLARNYTDYSFWGTEYRSRRTNLDEAAMENAVKLHYTTLDGRWQEISAHQLEFLGRITALCRERKVEVFLLNTPVHRKYAEKVPPRFVENYYRSTKALEGSGVHVLDFHSLALDDSCYGDSHHLNARGAAYFTGLVLTEMNKLEVKNDRPAAIERQ